MQVILIFTYGVSLKDWNESGLLDREILIYKELIKKYNIKFTFLTYGTDEDEKLLTENNISIIPIYKIIKKSKFKFLNYIKSILITFKLRKYLKDIDLIKTNQLNGAWLGIILKYLLKKPLYVRTGYNIHEFKSLQNSRFYIILFYKYLTKLAYFSCDIFSITSQVDKEKIALLTQNSAKLKVIKNFVPDVSEKDNKKRISDRLFSVGRLESQKNYTSVIKILKNSAFGLDVVGSGTLKNELINISENSGVSLNFIENLNNSDLLKLYKKYKYFILNSDYEGNPKVVIEALANGCMVICKDNLNVRELIINNKNGFLYKNEDEILKIVKKLENNKDLYEQIVIEGFKTIKNEHLLEIILKKEIDTYNKLTF